jgi:hypothetical protein
MLAHVPYPHDLHRPCRRYPVDDEIGTAGKFAGARNLPRSSHVGACLKAVARGNKLHSDAGRGSGIALADIGPDTGEVRHGLRREDYGHSGGGCSSLVPHDRSQSRTVAYATERPELSETRPCSTPLRRRASSAVSGLDVVAGFAMPIRCGPACRVASASGKALVLFSTAATGNVTLDNPTPYL